MHLTLLANLEQNNIVFNHNENIAKQIGSILLAIFQEFEECLWIYRYSHIPFLRLSALFDILNLLGPYMFFFVVLILPVLENDEDIKILNYNKYRVFQFRLSAWRSRKRQEIQKVKRWQSCVFLCYLWIKKEIMCIFWNIRKNLNFYFYFLLL